MTGAATRPSPKFGKGDLDLHSDRLTRQELAWLLTQEARSAAEKLRKGVAILSAPEVRALTSPPAPSVEPELNALDDAMRMLANLQHGASTRGRRGRIDLAALLWEVAPSARVSIEPGSGTEVFGDEGELRRMLQVLVGANGPTGGVGELGTPDVSIRREAGEIRVSVTLGPDSSANAETERAWLSRMAVRYGGRLELEGGTESILLPAEGATEEREVESLRRELEAAQRQGEAYARELAAVFSYSQSGAGPRFSSKPPETGVTLSALSGMASALVPQIRGIFSVLERSLSALHEGRRRASDAPPTGFPEAEGATITGQMSLGSELVIDLVQLSHCPPHEGPRPVDLSDLVRDVVREINPRAERRGVTLDVATPGSVSRDTRPTAAKLLVRTLLSDAITATPRGGTVNVHLEEHAGVAALTVADGGPAIPPESWGALLSTQIDPSAVGRPSSMAMFCAAALASHLGIDVAPVEVPGKKGAIVVKF
jgi:signal transduction histidine kinase